MVGEDTERELKQKREEKKEKKRAESKNKKICMFYIFCQHIDNYAMQPHR